MLLRTTFVLFNFDIATFIEFSLVSALIFMIPFILALGFFFSSFCVCFECKGRLFFFMFFFLEAGLYAMHFLNTACY